MEQQREIVSSWDTLIYIIYNIPLIRDLILNNLCASDCASLLALAKYDLESHDIKRFLHPIRDVFDGEWDMDLFTKRDNSIVLIGKDLNLLLDRIKDPLRFWKLNPISVPINIFTIIILPWNSEDSGEWLQSCCVISESPIGTNMKHHWKITKSENGSNVNRLCCLHDTNYSRCIELSLGADWHIEMTREYTTMVPTYNDTAMCLVSRGNNQECHTKYIDLSTNSYEVNDASNIELSRDIKNRYRYIQLVVYHEECKEYADYSIIEFPIGKELIICE